MDEGPRPLAEEVGANASTLAARLARRDEDRFFGRETELAYLDRCLSDDPPACVVFVHGPGGIGKSTLLREFERRARAQGSSPEERAQSVRLRLREAVESAFGDTENERLLKEVLTRGYIEPVSSHEQTAHEISLSRAAYFRQLRTAAERVAEHLVNGGGAG